MRDRDGVGSEERGREKKSKALDLNGRNVERETKLSLYSPIDVDADTCCMLAKKKGKRKRRKKHEVY